MIMAGGLAGKTVLITGAAGMLGRAFAEVLAGYPCRLALRSHAALDVTDRAAVLAEQADIIIHCAADVNAERCEENPERTRLVQVEGARNVADLARASGARLFYPQSFLIFDGHHMPIDEQTPPAPLSVYGRCKLEAETVLMQVPDALVVRMAGFFGGEERDKNFVGLLTRKLAGLLADGIDRLEVGDRIWQPSWTVDLARNSAVLLDTGKTGLYTMSCHGEASFCDLAAACVEELGIGHRIRIDKVPAALVAHAEKARRPERAVMDNRRLRAEGLERMRPWRAALAEYLSRPYFHDLFAPYRKD